MLWCLLSYDISVAHDMCWRRYSRFYPDACWCLPRRVCSVTLSRVLPSTILLPASYLELLSVRLLTYRGRGRHLLMLRCGVELTLWPGPTIMALMGTHIPCRRSIVLTCVITRTRCRHTAGLMAFSVHVISPA